MKKRNKGRKNNATSPSLGMGQAALIGDANLNKFKDSNCHKVKIAVADIDGVLRGKYIHRDKFLSAAESGFGFCNVVFGWDSSDVCYDNGTYTGWHTGSPDALARIDLQTYRQIPWEGDLPFFLGQFESSHGVGLPICPRQVLRKVLKKAEGLGFKIQCGMEFEWFNFRETPQSFAEKRYVQPEPLTPGMFGYSLIRSSMNQPFFTALMDELRQFGIPIEGLHTETGPGVFEAAIQVSDALEAADRAVLFKTATKEIAQRFGIMPSFMAKWSSQYPGCSGHLHQSLWRLSESKSARASAFPSDSNLFYDETDPNRMSSLFKSYLAGQLACLPEILPFFAPTVNSYKRLVDGYWAPTQVAWGVDNRTTAFRVIPGSPYSTRLESRVPGSDVNPYLAVAAAIATGLYGIEKKLQLKIPPAQGSAYGHPEFERLPRNLWEATEKMRQSKIAREIFGDEFIDHFSKTRIWEWRQFQDSVTDWELKRYFEII